jgi:hypothetical protein
MSRLLVYFLILSVYLVSCTKSEPGQSGNEQSYNGQWQWISTSRGPSNTSPVVDSPVILSLEPDNSYHVTLSGLLTLRGTFTTDSSTFWNNIKFNDITLPAGDTTTVTRGNITEVYFNYSQIGRLVIFQNDEMTISGDTLTLLRTPITPETPVSLFKRISN